jgi:hypothetical protein
MDKGEPGAAVHAEVTAEAPRFSLGAAQGLRVIVVEMTVQTQVQSPFIRVKGREMMRSVGYKCDANEQLVGIKSLTCTS